MNEHRQGSDRVPFRGLEKFSEGKYHEVALPVDDPDLVVKIAKTEWTEEGKPGWYHLNDLEGVSEDLKLLKAASFSEFIPPTNLVVGENPDGEKVVYIAQDRIVGEDLDKSRYSEPAATQLKHFLNKSLRFFVEHLVIDPEHGPSSFFPDIKGVHFIFGKDSKKQEESARLYFIDTYPVHQVGVGELVDRYLPNHRTKYFDSSWHPLLLEFEAEIRQKLVDLGWLTESK